MKKLLKAKAEILALLSRIKPHIITLTKRIGAKKLLKAMWTFLAIVILISGLVVAVTIGWLLISSISFGTKTVVVLISCFVAIALIFTLIGIAKKKTKEYTAPAAKKGISPQIRRRRAWPWVILILAMISLIGWKVVLPKIAEADKPDFTLAHTPESGYVKLSMKYVIEVEVMPGVDSTALEEFLSRLPAGEPREEDEEAYWTDWLARPWNSREMWVEPHEEIEVQDRFADGYIGEPFFDDPTLRLTVDDLQRSDDDLTGVRFRNLTEKPIKVTIHLR